MKEKLKMVQCNPCQNLQLEYTLILELDSLLAKEEIYWKQRSRTNWLKHGDRNIKVFHGKANQRRKWNYIEKLQEPNGEWIESEDLIKTHTIDFFQSLYISEGGSFTNLPMWLMTEYHNH